MFGIIDALVGSPETDVLAHHKSLKRVTLAELVRAAILMCADAIIAGELIGNVSERRRFFRWKYMLLSCVICCEVADLGQDTCYCKA